MNGIKSTMTVLVLGGIGIALVGKAHRLPAIISASGTSFATMYKALSGRG
jgi:hypothetical protein